MRDISCILLSSTYKENSIGAKKKVGETEVEIPIIKTEEIYSKEFYEANQLGYKPSLRIRISTLNYSGQKELIYAGTVYSIIRDIDQSDETVLICERKAKNGKNSRSRSSEKGD